MEVGPGVFVSRVDADDWVPDPEVGGDQHVLGAVDGAFVGCRASSASLIPIRGW